MLTIPAVLHSDPGHAWLEIPKAAFDAVARAWAAGQAPDGDMAAVNDLIGVFYEDMASYEDIPSRMTPFQVYLEEDVAMPTFVRRAEEVGATFRPDFEAGTVHPHVHFSNARHVREALPYMPTVFRYGVNNVPVTLTCDQVSGTGVIERLEYAAPDPLRETDVEAGTPAYLVRMSGGERLFVPVSEAGLMMTLVPPTLEKVFEKGENVVPGPGLSPF